ncbi:early growth response 1 [Fusarium tjaetaba]|uniref:Early growth response 1 n=1 Tax=Fusarium tjaetaba TaxID=1567544 RepID=A0A8H5QF35_9HYPO|nr:early growth response 1 [Fusarium tjaetaba]KAF5614112.1 early growth response 1 [Fusarium tjaetaba]
MSTAEAGPIVSTNTIEMHPSLSNPQAAAAEKQALPAVMSANPFVCDICKSSYSRIDHLARHFRSHSLSEETLPFSPNFLGFQQPCSTGFFPDIGSSDLAGHNELGDELGCSWDAFSLDILNFGAIESQPLTPTLPNVDVTSGADERVSLGEDAYKKSFLLWTPKAGEHWGSRTSDLPPSLDGVLSACASLPQQHTPHIRLEESTRYRILSLMLSVAGSDDHHRILSSFPPLKVLEYLLSTELAGNNREVDSWLHAPSFNPNTACSELVLGLIIAGAFRSGSAISHRLALGLHELHRQLIARLFCSDGRNARLLEPVKCFVLMVQGGLWSGDSRTIEICESMLGMPITMMRRGGFFRLAYPGGASPLPGDSDVVLREKWHSWLDYELRKRLVLHLLILSTQYSMAFLTQPPLTPAEIHASLPAARKLWDAPTADAWREAYTSLGCSASKILLHTCIEDLQNILTLGNTVDAGYTTLAVLSGLWWNTWQYKERLKAQAKHSFSTQALYQEARESLESFAIIHTRALGPMKPSLLVLHERQLMYLDVSLEDLQLLGGKEGEREALCVLPRLREWAESRSCQEAMWHAGQILRAARQSDQGSLCESTVIALYHASLIFWSYSILSRARMMNIPTDLDEIVLDSEHEPLLQQLLMLGFGTPCITRVHPGTGVVQNLTIRVTDQPDVMMVFGNLLSEHHRGECKDCPSLVGNLTRLIWQLGQAAELVQRRQSLT